jgi:hypothetical protein
VLIHRRLPRARTLLLAAVAASAARPAPASAAHPTAAVQYRAPPECPGASAFLALLEDRTAGAWTVRIGDAAPDLVVEIRDESSGKVGRVRRPDHADEGSREIAAADCRDLVQALVLTTALSLEEREAAATAPAIVAKVPPPAVPDRSTWIIGAGVDTTLLFPSQPMPEASLFLERGRRAWPTGLAIVRPDTRLAITHARNDLFTSNRATFALSAAALTICPVSLGFTRAAGVRLCAAGELGMLSGEGVAVGTPKTTRFLWAAAGGGLRSRWSPGSRLTVEAQATLAAPFERTTFIFEMPRVEVAKVPAVVASGGLSIGFAIP